MGYSFGERSKARLKGVHPDLVRVLERAIATSPIDFTILQGLRTIEEQRRLVAVGASWTLKSRHLHGFAVDVAPVVDLDRDGKVESEEMFHWPLYPKLAAVIKQAAKDLGIPIEWGGDWRKRRDGPHFQLPHSKYPDPK